MSSSITLFALAAAGGLVLGWFLCHLAHTSARADAAFYREEAEVLRSKAIRIDEQRLSANAEAQALYEQLEELRSTMVVEVDDPVVTSIDLDDPMSAEGSETAAQPPVRPPSPPSGPGRLAEAFGAD